MARFFLTSYGGGNLLKHVKLPVSFGMIRKDQFNVK